MLSDPDLLDVTRKLRSFMTTFDNIHILLEKVSKIEDSSVTDPVYSVTPEVVTTAQKVSTVLKKLESSKQYREMIKRYNIQDEGGDDSE